MIPNCAWQTNQPNLENAKAKQAQIKIYFQFAHVKGLFILKLFSFPKSRHKMDWPPPTEDKTTLENTPCLGSGRQGLIQRLKNGRGMGGGGESVTATL